jgi:GNAT superfamily N-acetyltransferase
LIFDRYLYIGAFSGAQLVGYLMLGMYQGWTGKSMGLCGYLGDARVLPAYRGKNLTHSMMKAVEVFAPPEGAGALALIKKGNSPAESLAITAASEEYGGGVLQDFSVYNLPLLGWAGKPNEIRVHQATQADLESMQRLFQKVNGHLLFAPSFSFPPLPPETYWVAEEEGKLLGMMAAWDMFPLHYTRLLRYSSQGTLKRLGYNLIAQFFRGAALLPGSGGILRSLTLSRVAIVQHNPVVLRALLIGLLEAYRGKGYHLMSLGLVGDDPLREAVQAWPLVQRFDSRIYCIFHKRDLPDVLHKPVYLDLAMI